MNPRSRESPTNGYNGYGTLSDKRSLSDDEEDNRKRSCDSHSLSFGVNREKGFVQNGRGQSPIKVTEPVNKSKEVLGERTAMMANGVVQNGRSKVEDKDRIRHSKVSSSTQNRVARVSPDSQSDRIAATDSGPPESENIDTNSEFPDYLT